MKKHFLLFIFLLFACSFLFAQSWNSGTGSIFVNPASTNVGIGTLSPSYQFHLYNSLVPQFYIGNPKGAIRLGIAYNTGELAPNAQPGDAVFNIHGVDAYDNGIIFNFNNDDNNGGRYVKFCDWANNDIMAIYNNATVKIDGKLFAKEIEVKTNVWADFVFNSDYRLRPLSEVERFIKENNHLPDVPTETEVKDNGINLAEMNAKLLQKIEELTLYVIEQQKRIELLENEIK
jgi:hypothetical protein